jgi:uncharacterized protein (DUF4415 family)
MRNEYDFCKGKKNPYAKRFNNKVTIELPCDVLAYFQEQGKEAGIPYQTLINLYLMDCAKRGKKLTIPLD